MKNFFRSFFEASQPSNIDTMIAGVVADPEDEVARYALADVLEDENRMLESQILRMSEQSIFRVRIIEEDSNHEGGHAIDDNTGYYDWIDLVRRVRDFGGYPSSYPVTKNGASNVWLLTEPQQDMHTGDYNSYSLHISSKDNKDLPSLIMWLIFKSARVQGVT